VGRFGPAALIVAAIFYYGCVAQADSVDVEASKAPRGIVFDTSSRVRFGWSEITFRSDRPRAWDQSVSPEVRASLRVLSGMFEGKIEIGAVADRFAHVGYDTDTARAELQLGLVSGNWSGLLEWKLREVFDQGFETFRAELDTYDVRVRKRFVANLASGLPAGLFQASFATGYVAATPHLFARHFTEFELELLQRLDAGFVLLVAPKLELSDYVDFADTDRRDAVLSLRLAPAYDFGDGVTLSLEGSASVALSTLKNKTGETWSLTPILRLQKAF